MRSKLHSGERPRTLRWAASKLRKHAKYLTTEMYQKRGQARERQNMVQRSEALLDFARYFESKARRLT
jgi:hypothetical protein